MSERKRKSGGQAIVMVTLALFAMAGMMGLAVDLGWSFFVQKQAQASADGAAMAAVHRAFEILGGNSGLATCANLDCVGGDCKGNISGTTSSNLLAGCLYAKSNGFDWDTFPGSKQTVNIKANTGPLNGGANPPTVSNVNNIAYWATVRTVQTIPQLFSAISPGNGNAVGTVAAIATAALVAETIPASFYGMNRVGDCLASGGGLLSSAGLVDCGVDIDVAGAGALDPVNCPGGRKVILCGPAGIMLSSACNGGTVSFKGCADPGSGTQNYAGQDKGPGWVQSDTQVRIFGQGAVDTTKNATGFFNPGAVPGASQSNVADPFNGKTQPPIVASNADACELPTNTLTGGGKPLGPYQYYVKSGSAGSFTYGTQITISSTETFAKGGICPGTVYPAGGPSSGNFPGYVFYGGLNITGNVTFGNGQYVMAGNATSSAIGTGPSCPGCAFAVQNGTVSCGDCMFLTTDGVYTGTGAGGLNPPATLTAGLAATALFQGPVELKNSKMNLTGTAPSDATGALANFDNILFWQDRRNSTAAYNSDATTITPVMDPITGTVNVATQDANHVTNGSPEFQSDDGNAGSNLKGVIHQPVGAWMNYQPGSGSSSSSLQIFTGAFITRDPSAAKFKISGGATTMNLLPLVAPVVVYKTTLIQ